MSLFQKFEIHEKLEKTRNSLINLISVSSIMGWNEAREKRFIKLSIKEIELAHSLTI